MIWALSNPLEPPCVVEFHNTVSPPLTALPTCVHCWVGAAFQRMMPPNKLSDRFSLGKDTLFDGIGPVPAAKYATTTEEIAVALTTNGPSLPGEARAVGVTLCVDEQPAIMPATVDAVAMPDTRNSRMSTICVVAPPLSAM